MVSSESQVYHIPVFSNEETLASELTCWDEVSDLVDGVRIKLEVKNLTFEATNVNGYFFALSDLRAQLETKALLVGCYGGSKNVYPSPMIVAMGHGEKAYRLTLGKSARSIDLVNIFDIGDDVVPCTINDQREYYERWLKSLI